MIPESMTEAEKKLIEGALTTLGDHFDSVHIFCTRYEPETKVGGTSAINKGVGNWFARYGQIREWLICQDEEARLSQKQDRDERE